jgi:hypothetical protein
MSNNTDIIFPSITRPYIKSQSNRMSTRQHRILKHITTFSKQFSHVSSCGLSRHTFEQRIMSTLNVILPGMCVTYAQWEVQSSNQPTQFSTSNSMIIGPVIQTIRIKSKSRLDPISMISFFPTRPLVPNQMPSAKFRSSRHSSSTHLADSSNSHIISIFDLMKIHPDSRFALTTVEVP